MGNNMDIGQIIGLIRSGGNPQNMVCNMLSQMGGDDPMVQNVIGMIHGNDYAGIQQFIKNYCSEKGTSPEKMMEQAKKRFGF